ncbi:hypothetical protein FB45DRAFT_1059919 [Roridomyces roridus]|uniref:Nephrocystin 3-like N-terminal domain-containing protein n=1 Tax=Roridomyces roridus TaxID=1738132 RepID=A0AAD7BPM7_9AGAR|nr:hypothetical protein FB45DRAFT_1059919 [Roridomyces roridus]
MVGIVMVFCQKFRRALFEGRCGRKRKDSSPSGDAGAAVTSGTTELNVVQPTTIESSQSVDAPHIEVASAEAVSPTLKTAAELNVAHSTAMESSQSVVPPNIDAAPTEAVSSTRNTAAELNVAQPLALASSQSVIVRKVPGYIDTLKHGFTLLARKAEPFLDGTPFKIPIAVMNSFLELAGTVSDNKSTLRALLERLAETLDMVNGALEQAISEDAKERARKLCEFLSRQMEVFEALQERHDIIKILESDEDVTKIETAVKQIDGQLWTFQLAMTAAIEKKVDHSREHSMLQTLHRATATDASHDAGERFPAPQCHPQTRTGILQQLIDWASTDDASARIMWLHGPVGAGKSAIAQTLCQDLSADGNLVASFFFKRGDSLRSKSMKLFLPLHTSSPASSPLSLGALILEPSHRLPAARISVVVIDGLDECTDENRQQEIVRSIAQGLVGNPTPLRFLIASRPEPQIVELFQEPNLQNTHQQINITPSFPAVQTYLQDEFAHIVGHHKMMTGVPVPWPDQQVLAHLIYRSSGYFIYAATVIKFIDDPDFRPTDRLSIIMGMVKPKHGSPYAALDQLYTQILGEVPDHSQLLRILAVLVADLDLPMFQIEQLLGLQSGDVWLTLRRAHSLIDVPPDPMDDTELQPHHASFIDFLKDEARSGAFFTGLGSVHYQNLAADFLNAFSYTYEDPSLNASGHVAWRLDPDYIIRAHPTEDLVHRLRSFNPDFLFVKYPDVTLAERVLNWLKTIEPAPPEDLIDLWETYHFMVVCDGVWRRLSKKQVAIECLLDMEQVLAWPGLTELFHAYFFLYDARKYQTPTLDEIHHVLDHSWDDLRRIICPLRETIGEKDIHSALESLFISTCHPTRIHQLHPAETLQRLARGGMRTMINLTTNRLPDVFGATAPLWGSVLRACPPDPELLETLIEAERSSAISDPQRPFNKSNIHNAIEWLKTFPEPPRQLIERIQELLPTSDERGEFTNSNGSVWLGKYVHVQASLTRRIPRRRMIDICESSAVNDDR